MRRVVLALMLVAACGGPQIPAHNGYRSDKAKPWKKAKVLKFNDQMEAKADGDLSYPDMRRAAWFDIGLDQPSELDLLVEITPPGDGVNDNFDLGFEVLDPGNRKIIRKDLDEGDQQSEDKKSAQLKDLAPGHYLVHLYLQSRLDTADYVLHATIKPAPPQQVASDFPAEVPFPSPLPMVPVNDDTPKGYKPPTTVVIHTTPHHPGVHHVDPPKPVVETMTARIIGVSVVQGGTQITVGRGTSSGATSGMHGQVTGLPNGSFTLGACSERTCTALVAATPDQIKGGSVTLTKQ
ncbi:MAG TPA: hypothetical protein VLX92_29320 [Kofleriaceae bacterium]|nr:hypothetical protein [Kofleriaceae bacterium]